MKDDPVLFKKIGKNKLYIYSSHKLPTYLQEFPFYDRALPRICKELNRIDKKLEVIDIGANIGDTVSLISGEIESKFLCIEGDKKYLSLLKKNVNLLKNAHVEIEENYCAESSPKNLFVKNQNGTARLVPSRVKIKNQINNFKSLDAIVQNHPKFKNANLLKIDTDGYEIDVLKSGKKFIPKSHPVIFLEFTPSSYEDLNQNYNELLEILINYGYEKALFYDNFGVPVQIQELNNFQDIKDLISKIDDKNIYYYDLLLVNKNDCKKYENLFTNELTSHIKKANDLYKKIYNKLAFTKKNELELKDKITEVNKKNIELRNMKSKLDKKITEVNKKNIELINDINIIQNTKLWIISEKIRLIGKIIFPKNSIRRKIIKKFGRLFEYTFCYLPNLLKVRVKNSTQYFQTNANRKSKKIVYIGHSYHEKTQSTAFFINYLKKYFDVEVILDETWKGNNPPNLDFIDDSYCGVIFFQLLPSPDNINKIKNKNIILIPMYDGHGAAPKDYWMQYKKIKFINFSKTLHHKLINFGLNSIYLQYFPKPGKFLAGNKTKVFFWQRLTQININTLEKLFSEYKNLQIHVHKAIDPKHTFIKPTKRQEQGFNITYSNWFKNKDDLMGVMKDAAIYIAPRINEGIGLSFLEAMAMGKAVVAVNNPTMNEYIKDKKTGYLFDLDNATNIKLKNLEKIQKNSYQFIKRGHKKWETKKKKIINFIRQ